MELIETLKSYSFFSFFFFEVGLELVTSFFSGFQIYLEISFCQSFTT